MSADRRGPAHGTGFEVPTGYAYWATECLKQAEEADAAVRPLMSKPPDAERRALRLRADLLSDTATMFASLAVEGFINFYGVWHLTEPVFLERFERITPVPKKLKKTVAAAGGKRIKKSDEIYRVTHDLFEARNALAHPKTTTINDRTFVVRRNRWFIDNAAAAVGCMQAFFKLFPEYDDAPDVDCVTEVPKQRPYWTAVMHASKLAGK